MVSQIVVSVSAAVCVGLITNSYFEQKPASVEPAAQTAAAATTSSAVEAPGLIVVGTNSDTLPSVAPARPLQPVAQSPIRDVTVAPMPTVEAPQPAGAVAESSLPPLQAETIADLPVHDATSASSDAEIFPGVPAESTLADLLREPAAAAAPEVKRRHFLGLPLPYFVPTASDLMQSASAAGGKIVALVDR